MFKKEDEMTKKLENGETEEIKDFNDSLSDDLRRLAITKKLNFLLGSGASAPAISLMSQIEEPTVKEIEDLDENIPISGKTLSNEEKEKIAKNKKLIEEIKEVSEGLLDKTLSNTQKTKLEELKDFIRVISEILNFSNSRETPREATIFTTNYDLFIEEAVDETLREEASLVFNDGARGYFNRYLDSSNFNRTVSYEGLNNNYIDELPSLTLIKPHGSVNWEKVNENNEDKVIIKNEVVESPMVVPPTGNEGRDTFMDNHFHDMLRVFQLELDKPESILFVLGFSFQDDHIARMIRRALRNRSLIIECFCWEDKDEQNVKKNLGYSNGVIPQNLKFVKPSQFKNKDNLELKDLTAVLRGNL